MEVKPGYKQTEVGVIPEEWEVKPLGGAGHWFSGGTPSMATDLYWNGDIPWVSAKDMKVSRLRDSLLHVTEKAIGNGTRIAQTGAVLIVVRGMILAHTLPVAVADCPVAFNQDMKALVTTAETDSEFMLVWLQANAQTILGIASESTHGTKRLASDDLFSMQVALPPLPEQRAIARALSDVDALLGALDRLIAKKRDLKEAAMQQLLTGQTRLPGFNDEWEVKRLKAIVQTPVTDGPHLTPKFLDDGIPFLSVNNLVDNRIDLSDLRFVSRADHEVFSQKCKPRKNDILLGKAASVGKVALVELEIEFNIWSPIALIRVNSDNAPRFVYYQFQGADVIRQITLLTNSSSQGNIGMGEIEKLTLKLPLLPEQTAIAEVLADMDAEVAMLEQRREKTRALKQAMMQELLAGRTRITLPEEAHA